ncbi:unnamed protein product [Pleuronectes platessa]|uniref:Uncharacterized protein n=1 Tax=Pleuronectes platessa TaxID=8262 RepID=A0A9N7TKF1_PLEPL|nr:unnamed protein product [Pleuronectes platessa]
MNIISFVKSQRSPDASSPFGICDRHGVCDLLLSGTLFPVIPAPANLLGLEARVDSLGAVICGVACPLPARASDSLNQQQLGAHLTPGAQGPRCSSVCATRSRMSPRPPGISPTQLPNRNRVDSVDESGRSQAEMTVWEVCAYYQPEKKKCHF